MTILEALEECQQNQAGIETFLYAGAGEANYLFDQLQNASLPVLLVAPFDVVDNKGTGGAIASTFELDAVLVTKSEKITVDYKQTEIDAECIAPMRLLAKRYIHRLDGHSVIDPETRGIETVTYSDEYGLADSHLFGVRIRCTVPVRENLLTCTP